MSQNLILSVLVGAVKPQPVPKTVIDALSDVQVTSVAKGQSGFQLKFTLGKESPVNLDLLAGGYFNPRERVIVMVTFRGSPHVLIDGVITKQDVSPSETAGATTLSITGLDLSVLMDAIDLTGIPYPALIPSAIVAIVLAKYAVFGVIPVVVPSLISLIQNPLERFGKQRGTDLNYIKLLASKVGHVFYVDSTDQPGVNLAYWGPEVRHGAQQPALSVNVDGISNVESLGFAYDGLKRRQYVAVILEPNSKIPIPIPLPEVTLLKPTLAQDSAVVMKTKNIMVSRFNAAEAVQIGLAAMAGASDAVTAKGRLDVARYGHVLRPRQLVPVRGAGTNFDGLYYVDKVTHKISRGEFKQEFGLVRGGTKSTISQVSA